MKPSTQELENRFGYHRPSPDAVKQHQTVRNAVLELATLIVSICPEGRELSLALTSLEEVGMRANQAIAMTQPLALGQ